MKMADPCRCWSREKLPSQWHQLHSSVSQRHDGRTPSLPDWKACGLVARTQYWTTSKLYPTSGSHHTTLNVLKSRDVLRTTHTVTRKSFYRRFPVTLRTRPLSSAAVHQPSFLAARPNEWSRSEMMTRRNRPTQDTPAATHCGVHVQDSGPWRFAIGVVVDRCGRASVRSRLDSAG